MMGIRQASPSNIERQDDLLVSTLRRYVEKLGGALEVRALLPDRTVVLRRCGSHPPADEAAEPALADVAG